MPKPLGASGALRPDLPGAQRDAARLRHPARQRAHGRPDSAQGLHAQQVPRRLAAVLPHRPPGRRSSRRRLNPALPGCRTCRPCRDLAGQSTHGQDGSRGQDGNTGAPVLAACQGTPPGSVLPRPRRPCRIAAGRSPACRDGCRNAAVPAGGKPIQGRDRTAGAAPLSRVGTRSGPAPRGGSRHFPVPSRDRTPALPAETARPERCRPDLTCTCNGRDGKDAPHHYPQELSLDRPASDHASTTTTRRRQQRKSAEGAC